ncbi:MAG: DUF5658 family protein [Candidatus Dormiibacterota bacterium]
MQAALQPSHGAHRTFRLTRPAGAPSLTGRAFLTAWAAYVVLSGVDCLTTAYALAHHLGENNPIAARLYYQWGAGALWAFKFAVLAVMLPLLALLPRRLAVVVAAVLAAIMWLNDASNVAWILHTL